MIRLFENDEAGQFRRRRQNTWVEYTITGKRLSEWKPIESELVGSMVKHMKAYSELPAAKMLARQAPRAFEQLMMKKYESTRPDPDRFPPHIDAYDVDTSVRLLGFIWYLNDVAEGGETEFPELGVRIRPKAGRLVVLPPMWMYVHIGHPPLSAPKYIVTSYLNFRDAGDELRFAYRIR